MERKGERWKEVAPAESLIGVGSVSLTGGITPESKQKRFNEESMCYCDDLTLWREWRGRAALTAVGKRKWGPFRFFRCYKISWDFKANLYSWTKILWLQPCLFFSFKGLHLRNYLSLPDFFPPLPTPFFFVIGHHEDEPLRGTIVFKDCIWDIWGRQGLEGEIGQLNIMAYNIPSINMKAHCRIVYFLGWRARIVIWMVF